MLATHADFPFAGSFALYSDPTLPPGQRRAELARILEHADPAAVLVSLPLRLDANAVRRVALAELIDGTQLTREEDRELAYIDRALKGRTRRRASLTKRRDALRNRAIWSVCLKAELAKWGAAQARKQAA